MKINVSNSLSADNWSQKNRRTNMVFTEDFPFESMKDA